jgi:hypothetical protein
MNSPVRRGLLLLRQYPALLGGPWLGVCAVSFVLWKSVQRITYRMFPMSDLRALRASGYANMDAIKNNIRANLIRQGAVGCVEILEYALKVIALALTIVLVAHIATYGGDTFSAAKKRLGKVPGVIGTLLKLFLLVLAIGFGTSLIAALPVVLYVPWEVRHGGLRATAPFPRWALILSADVGGLLFVCCVMPFFLDFVVHLEQRSSADADVRKGLLGRAIAYGAVTFLVEVALGLLLRPLLTPLSATPGTATSIPQSLIGLAINLITSVPTVLCVVAIALSAMQPVTEAEAA